MGRVNNSLEPVFSGTHDFVVGIVLVEFVVKLVFVIVELSHAIGCGRCPPAHPGLRETPLEVVAR